MKKIKLLDCTLRDGGYVNDWEFGHNNLISIFERLVDAGVDIIEIGFLDDRRPFDINRSIMPNTASSGRIWEQTAKKPGMVVGMIDYGTCKIGNLQPCSENFIDGIRVIFKKHIMKEALEYCAEVKKLGYKVFAQLVSITSYSDEELIALTKLVNDVKPYAVSMVDTYGLLTPNDLLHYYEILDKNVLPEIQIGFHAHNNFQLAYANTITFMEKESSHDIVVDGTLYGMGKSAGNAPLELIAGYTNEKFNTKYNISPMLEAITESVMDFYAKNPWGYQMFYYLSAANRCHPNYVNYLYGKENLSPSKINDILGQIEPEEKKLLYDKNIAEKTYENYIDQNIKNQRALEELIQELSNKTLLLMGPGKNVKFQKGIIEDFVNKEKPVIISINYLPADFDIDYIFVTKRNRYLELTEHLYDIRNKEIKIIATSNVESRTKKFEYVVDRAPLLDKKSTITDNSFLMLLKLLKQFGIKKVSCAGFDGYSSKDDNYFNPMMEYSFIKEEAYKLNTYIRDVLNSEYKDIHINFLTYSHYTEEDDCYSGAF
ncbi:MAG: aldolase catalytic domain-containing protein [Lachnospiraceae bacterium]|nr:aldolase catalytic domain-containing protein [Lachnospiraceae bacterium]